jgi:hypothetical protein
MQEYNGSYMTDCAVDEGSCRDHAKAQVSARSARKYADEQAFVGRIWEWSDKLVNGGRMSN